MATTSWTRVRCLNAWWCLLAIFNVTIAVIFIAVPAVIQRLENGVTFRRLVLDTVTVQGRSPLNFKSSAS